MYTLHYTAGLSWTHCTVVVAAGRVPSSAYLSPPDGRHDQQPAASYSAAACLPARTAPSSHYLSLPRPGGGVDVAALGRAVDGRFKSLAVGVSLFQDTLR